MALGDHIGGPKVDRTALSGHGGSLRIPDAKEEEE
jgi:hypothetical protein